MTKLIQSNDFNNIIKYETNRTTPIDPLIDITMGFLDSGGLIKRIVTLMEKTEKAESKRMKKIVNQRSAS